MYVHDEGHFVFFFFSVVLSGFCFNLVHRPKHETYRNVKTRQPTPRTPREYILQHDDAQLFFLFVRARVCVFFHLVRRGSTKAEEIDNRRRPARDCRQRRQKVVASRQFRVQLLPARVSVPNRGVEQGERGGRGGTDGGTAVGGIHSCQQKIASENSSSIHSGSGITRVILIVEMRAVAWYR